MEKINLKLRANCPYSQLRGQQGYTCNRGGYRWITRCMGCRDMKEFINNRLN